MISKSDPLPLRVNQGGSQACKYWVQIGLQIKAYLIFFPNLMNRAIFFVILLIESLAKCLPCSMALFTSPFCYEPKPCSPILILPF